MLLTYHILAVVCNSGGQSQGSPLQHVTPTTGAGNKFKPKCESDDKKSLNENKITSSKILVRNVPFEATQKEVQELFRAFGGLKSVRLPKKFSGTGTHRGFAFVEFNTCHEAEVIEFLIANERCFTRRYSCA